MNVITQHPAITALVGYYLFSSMVGGMPPTTATSPWWYVWLHNSLHLLAGNISTVVASKYPQLPSGAVQVTQSTTATVVPGEPK